MAELRDLLELQKLKKLPGGGSFDVSLLESEFMSLSERSHSNVLNVRLPKLYSLKGEEKTKARLAAEFLGIIDEEPKSLDISGGFSDNHNDKIVMVSLGQVNCDQCTNERSYLGPLIEKIYTDGARMITDFTIHEPIAGTVYAKRGEVDLKDIAKHPSKFTHGPYRLVVNLDTPKCTAKRFIELDELLSSMKKDPKESMLDKALVEDAVSKGLSLRSYLGSLSRYRRPDTTTFEVMTNSCVTEDGNYFLHKHQKKQNLVIYFDAPPCTLLDAPNCFKLLSANDSQNTLASLVGWEIFEPGKAVLGQRIKELETIAGSSQDVDGLLNALTGIREGLEGIEDKVAQKKYILSQPNELLEFIVYPATNDPVVHSLLPRLSWNSNLRQYHDTKGFKKRFCEGSGDVKQEMLRQVKHSILFNNQQNQDVNNWLYNNYREFCTSKGIDFKIQQPK